MSETEQFGGDLSEFLRGVSQERRGPIQVTDPHRPDVDGDLKHLFIRNPETGDAVSFERDPESDGETLIVRNTRRLPDGQPFTTRLRLDRNLLQSFSAVPIDDPGEVTTYGLQHEPTGEVADNIRLTVRKYGGPQRKDQTYHGTFEAVESEEEYEIFSVVDPSVTVIIVLAGAAVCAGAIAVGAIVHDCASDCAGTCGGGDNVKSCKADIDFGLTFEDGNIEIGCSHECEVNCKSASDSESVWEKIWPF